MDKPIYLDHHATTPTDQRVLNVMLPYFTESFGNVGSKHCFGTTVRKACELARKQVADLINADPSEIIFTSGATESDNMAIKGVAEALENIGKHIITSSIEHKAVLDCCKYLESRGFEITYLKPDSSGQHTAEQVEKAIRNGATGGRDKTILISIMGANNEIGVLNPICEIGNIARKHDVIFHCDGAQTVGKIPFDAKSCKVDMVSLSAHKMYGPKGIGALYVTKDNSNLNLVPLFHGGGQECGLRSGTLPVPLVVGLGKACEISALEMQLENEQLTSLRQLLLESLEKNIGSVKVNGTYDLRLPGNLNVCFSGIESEFLALAFKNIAVSQSSACSSGAAKPSYVLKAIGLTDEEAMCSVRFGIGRSTTSEQIAQVVEKIREVYAKFGDNVKKKRDRLQEAGC